MSRPLGYTDAPMGSGDSYRRSTGHHEPYPKPHQQPYSQPRQQSVSSYQPPSQRQQHQTNSVSFGPNPYQTSEEAFVNLSSTLLRKHAAYNYPPNYILYNHLSDAERRHFAQAYHSYLNREEVTTYAEVGERPIVQTLREVGQVFGPTLDGMAEAAAVVAGLQRRQIIIMRLLCNIQRISRIMDLSSSSSSSIIASSSRQRIL